MINQVGKYPSKKAHKWPNKDHHLSSIKYLTIKIINHMLNPPHGKIPQSTPLLSIVLPSLINITQKLTKTLLTISLLTSSKIPTFLISPRALILIFMVKWTKSLLIKGPNDFYQLIIFTIYQKYIIS